MKSTDTIKGSTLLLVQTQMILVLACFSTVQPFQNRLHLKLTAATVFLTNEECYVSHKSFSKGKSPGTDVLTAEFYLSFWEMLEQELVDSFNYACEKGEITISQKRGFITLIPKKDKNRTLLDNWRPISLLNTDYKVATKLIAARIAKVLPSLIHEDQTGYIKGCFIGQNIRLLANIREHDDNLVEDDRK